MFAERNNIGLATDHTVQSMRSFKSNEIYFRGMLSKWIKMAICASFYLFIRSNQSWTNPNLLKF